MLQLMGLQRVEYHCVTELKMPIYNVYTHEIQ